MEGIFGWIVLIFIYVIIKAIFTSADESIAAKTNLFSADVEKTKYEGFDVFSIKVSGVVSVPNDNYPVKMRTHICDKTGGVEIPVMCMIQEYQRAGTTLFEHETGIIEMPYSVTSFKKPLELFVVPIDSLLFSKKGLVNLLFTVQVIDQNNMRYAMSEVDFTYHNQEDGWEDLEKNTTRVQELTIYLAMYMSKADGIMDKSEGDVIRNWVKKKLNPYDDRTEEEIKKEKSRFNDIIADAYTKALNDKVTPELLCEEIVNKASTAQRYEILELCLDIVGADNKAEKSELDIVNNLSKLLEIDQGKFNKMKERQLPIKMHVEKDDPCSIVGVTSEMSSEEIRIHINSEYSKWNRRTTHSDPKIREQADEMMMLIAECRKKHF